MTSKSEDIVASIRDAITAHRLQPGVQLREVGLGRIYGVSRTVIRQALQALAREGLVDMEPGRIASVAQPSLQEARNTFDLRLAVERHAVLTLSARMDTKVAKTLRAHVRRERSARAAGDDALVTQLGAEFHVLVAELAGNALLTKTLEQLLSRIALILLLYRHDYKAHVECLQDEHEELIALLEKGSTEEALALLARHLGVVESSLRVGEAVEPVDDPLQRALVPTR